MRTFYFKFFSTFLTYYFMFFFHNNCWTGRIRTAVAEAQNLQFCVFDHSTTVQYNFMVARTGFEPVNTSVKSWRLRPLVERAIQIIIFDAIA